MVCIGSDMPVHIPTARSTGKLIVQVGVGWLMVCIGLERSVNTPVAVSTGKLIMPRGVGPPVIKVMLSLSRGCYLGCYLWADRHHL